MSEQKDTAERKKKLLDLVKQLSELSEEDLYFLIGYLEGKCKYKEVDGQKEAEAEWKLREIIEDFEEGTSKMMKEEFESLIGSSISVEDYAVVERVYMFHPAISETAGKEEVSELYKKFGMAIFMDMLQRAEMAENLIWKIRQNRKRIAELEKQFNELKYGRIERKQKEEDFSEMVF